MRRLPASCQASRTSRGLQWWAAHSSITSAWQALRAATWRAASTDGRRQAATRPNNVQTNVRCPEKNTSLARPNHQQGHQGGGGRQRHPSADTDPFGDQFSIIAGRASRALLFSSRRINFGSVCRRYRGLSSSSTPVRRALRTRLLVDKNAAIGTVPDHCWARIPCEYEGCTLRTAWEWPQRRLNPVLSCSSRASNGGGRRGVGAS